MKIPSTSITVNIGDADQLAECLSYMHKILGYSPALQNPGPVAYICNSRTQEVNKRPEIQGTLEPQRVVSHHRTLRS